MIKPVCTSLALFFAAYAILMPDWGSVQHWCLVAAASALAMALTGTEVKKRRQ